jgi:uncharacterized membrane protein
VSDAVRKFIATVRMLPTLAFVAVLVIVVRLAHELFGTDEE